MRLSKRKWKKNDIGNAEQAAKLSANIKISRKFLLNKQLIEFLLNIIIFIIYYLFLLYNLNR